MVQLIVLLVPQIISVISCALYITVIVELSLNLVNVGTQVIKYWLSFEQNTVLCYTLYSSGSAVISVMDCTLLLLVIS